nr:PE family protein [Mycobacterium innocens]
MTDREHCDVLPGGVPEILASSAGDVANLCAALSAANAAAATPTTTMLAAGADEVSAAIASLFSKEAQAYQALSAQMEAFHQQFVQALNAGAVAYASAETTNVVELLQQQALNLIKLMRPPICCWGDRWSATAPRDRAGPPRPGRRTVVRQRRERRAWCCRQGRRRRGRRGADRQRRSGGRRG